MNDTPADDIQPDDKDWTWVLDRRCEQCGFEAALIDQSEIAPRAFVAAEEWVQILRSSPAVSSRPAPGVWSPLEYGAHVRDVYAVMDRRLELMLTEEEPTFPNWDQDATARDERYGEQDPEEVAVALEAGAERFASRLAGVREDELERRGLRSNGSEFTVASLGRYFLHDVVHHLWDVTGQQDGVASLQLES